MEFQNPITTLVWNNGTLTSTNLNREKNSQLLFLPIHPNPLGSQRIMNSDTLSLSPIKNPSYTVTYIKEKNPHNEVSIVSQIKSGS